VDVPISQPDHNRKSPVTPQGRSLATAHPMGALARGLAPATPPSGARPACRICPY